MARSTPARADVTVVVPTRNEAHNIRAFLGSLPPALPLIVVDASDDATPEIVLVARPHNTRLLRLPDSITVARQAGLEIAHTPWVLFTDADVVFAPGYFARLCVSGSDDVVYGPKLSLDAYRHYYRWFAHGQRLAQALGLPAASGSNLLVRRDAALAVGGFDLALNCNEDSELVWRLKARGYRTRFASGLIVYATDHRRLRRGRLRKTLHTMARCALLASGLMPRRWRSHDWGYWAERDPG